jgi:hypothetical protein
MKKRGERRQIFQGARAEGKEGSSLFDSEELCNRRLKKNT